MGKPSAGILAMAIFPKEFEAADPEDRKKLTEKCRQAVRRCTKEPQYNSPNFVGFSSGF